jgi:FKBP-type peptidyl-prolyl cis-trans isomerase
MLRLLPLALLLSAFFLGACDENVSPRKQAEIDRGLIEAYVAEKGLAGQFTESGLYYVIESPGTGDDFPSASSTVEIIYKGYLLDGTVFDDSEGFPTLLNLGSVIAGWREGLQLFKRDAKGKLIIPSGLAYGTASPSSLIPKNSVLVFDIELLDF